MTFSALYLLPAVALLILFQGSLVFIKGNLQFRSRGFQNRTHARVFFFRALVASLFVATAATKVIPLADMKPLTQGLLTTLVLMIPVGLYTAFRYMRADNYRKTESLTPSDSQTDAAAKQSDHTAAMTSTSQRKTAAPDLTQPDLTQPDLTQPDLTQPDATPRAMPAEKRVTTSLHRQESDNLEESAMDQTLSVSEQLETLDDLVHFHDIGDDDYQQPSKETSAGDSAMAFNPLERAIAIAREGILEEPAMQDLSRENLPARSSTELAEMVVRLRSDKMKLQKLVIAQKAVIDAEKQAHDRTRVVVKDAISVMRHARHGQRIAEKIARRERTERQRLEKDLDKVKLQLDNAMSTIGADKRPLTEQA